MPEGSRYALSGRTALVTGAGNGLGRAIAMQLGGIGVRVIATGRTRAALQETAGMVADRTRGAVRVELVDVTDPASVAALADTLADEQVSILVNNAGVPGPVASLIDIELADWNAVFDVNVSGVFLMCRAFLPPMIARGTGTVINLASVSGKRPLARRTPYCASKMAVIRPDHHPGGGGRTAGYHGEQPLARAGQWAAHGTEFRARGGADRPHGRPGAIGVRRSGLPVSAAR